ncbi:SRPBCC family protein [Streptomyces coeruleoprunus]|uniref:SRPBCC family protein n=1 Tax=Streptomyces coeruleoprunus TaxID=285563 RepID=A0ABV9XM98_9ACTN
MRYADGPTVTCETSIEAPPASVWGLVTDIGLPARLSPELQRAEWLDGARGLAVGARFEGRNHHELLGDWRTHACVTELVEERVFAWAVVDPDDRFGGGEPDWAHPLASWRFELAPRDGGTVLRQSARIGPARSGVSLAVDRAPDREEAIVAMRLGELRTNIEATLRGIKSLAETGEQA